MCAHHMIKGIELAESYFYKAFGLFITMKHHILIQGVISGTIPGRIFLSNNGDTAVLSNPKTFFWEEVRTIKPFKRNQHVASRNPVASTCI